MQSKEITSRVHSIKNVSLKKISELSMAKQNLETVSRRLTERSKRVSRVSKSQNLYQVSTLCFLSWSWPGMDGYIDVGNRCWRQLLLATILRDLRTIFYKEKVTNIVKNAYMYIMILSPTSWNCRHCKVTIITVTTVPYFVILSPSSLWNVVRFWWRLLTIRHQHRLSQFQGVIEKWKT